MAKGPTRRQGTGKPPENVRIIKKANRDLDPHLGSRRGGYHDNPAVYDRKDDDTRDRLEEHQTDEARRAVEKLFEATPEELGEAAVKEAKDADPQSHLEKEDETRRPEDD